MNGISASGLSSAASVVMMQAMQNRKTDNLSPALALIGHRDRDRNGLSEPLVRSGMIEVVDILRHLEQEVTVAQNEQEIQALPPQAAHEAFAKRKRPRCPDGLCVTS